jgi:hypothetical protein
MPPSYVCLALYAFRRAPIDDAKHSTALFGLSNDHFEGIGSRTEYGTYFGHVPDSGQHIDGVCILQ